MEREYNDRINVWTIKGTILSTILALSGLILFGFACWSLYYNAKEFNDSHKEEVTSVVVTIDELKTRRQLVGKVMTTHYYIVVNDEEVKVDSDVYYSLEEGDKFVLQQREWVNKETGEIDKIEYEVE